MRSNMLWDDECFLQCVLDGSQVVELKGFALKKIVVIIIEIVIVADIMTTMIIITI